MSFRWESIEGWNFVLSSHFYSEKQIPREQTEKPRSAKELLGFFLCHISSKRCKFKRVFGKSVFLQCKNHGKSVIFRC